MELRPTALVEAKFSDLLRQLAEAFNRTGPHPRGSEDRVGAAAVAGAKGCPVPDRPGSDEQHRQALGATRIRLTLRCDDDGLQLTIQDDGRGFDGNAVQAQSLGIGIMRERGRIDRRAVEDPLAAGRRDAGWPSRCAATGSPDQS